MNRAGEAAWSARLGVVAILFGMLFSASTANELMKFSIVGSPPYTIATMPEPDCEEDELVEEGLSETECRQLALAVHDTSISSPAWFVPFYRTLSAVQSVVALLSVIVGMALVNGRSTAGTAAIAVFGALTLLDTISFMAVVNTGPLLRQMYLWNGLIWIVIHGTMAIAAITGRQKDAAGTVTVDV